jgi:uncharacterized protein (TIGR02246 family)
LKEDSLEEQPLMSRLFRRAIALFLFAGTCLIPIAMSSCNGASTSSTDAIVSAREEWAKSLHAKQLDAFVNLYTPDAMFLVNGDRFTGRDAIRSVTKRAMDAFTSDIHFQSASTIISGDLAYDSADYNETLTAANGIADPHRGNYLTIYKRQPDGKWLIAQQIWTEKVAGSHD